MATANAVTYKPPFWCTKQMERYWEIQFLYNCIAELYTDDLTVLDVGCAGAGYVELLYELGDIKYTGLDANTARLSGMGLLIPAKSSTIYSRRNWQKLLKRIETINADIISYESEIKYDVVMSISVIEHIANDEYKTGYKTHSEADIEAVESMKRLVKPGGHLLLTFPAGKEMMFRDIKVYGEDRINKLIGNWNVIKEKYWIYETDTFIETSKEIALKYQHHPEVQRKTKGVCGLLLRQ